MKPVLGRVDPSLVQGDMRPSWYQFHKNSIDSYGIPIDIPQPQIFYGIQNDTRPPQVFNQRFIQYVNNYPGRPSLPYMLQPPYLGCDCPQLHPDSLRVPYHEPFDLQRHPFSQPRLPTADWNRLPDQDLVHRSDSKRDMYAAGDFAFNPFQEKKCEPIDLSKEKTSKQAIYEAMKQNEANKDRFNHMSPFNAMAVNVCQEIEGIIGTGGPGLVDMLDFCKAIQSFMVTPVTQICHRTMMLREMILSFIHISSAYIHLSSILQMPEQQAFIQNDLNSLKNICSRWEEMSAMVIMSLRSMINLISQDAKLDFPRMNKKLQESSMEQENGHETGQLPILKPNEFNIPNQNFLNEPPLLNYSLGDNFHRFGTYSRQGHNRQDLMNNQNFEFKRKFQPNLMPMNMDLDVNHFNTFNHFNNTPNNGLMKNNFTLKNKGYIPSSLSFPSLNNIKNKKLDPQNYQTDCVSDSDKSNSQNVNNEIKNFNFNIQNKDKKKTYSPLSPNEPEKIIMKKFKDNSGVCLAACPESKEPRASEAVDSEAGRSEVAEKDSRQCWLAGGKQSSEVLRLGQDKQPAKEPPPKNKALNSQSKDVLSPEVLLRLGQDNNPAKALNSQSKDVLSPEVLLCLSQDNHPAKALNSQSKDVLSPEVLLRLSQDNHSAKAMNSQSKDLLSPEVLLRLSQDNHPAKALNSLSKDGLSPEVLLRLGHDNQPANALNSQSKDGLSPEVLLRLGQDNHPAKALNSQSKDGLSTEVLLRLGPPLQDKAPAKHLPKSQANKYTFVNTELNKPFSEQSDSTKLQLKHKMLDTLGFVQSIDMPQQQHKQEGVSVHKEVQEGLNKVSYLVYSDKYKSLSDMLKDVRDMFLKARVENMENNNIMKMMDEIESNFLSLFRKEFGFCTINPSN